MDDPGIMLSDADRQELRQRLLSNIVKVDGRMDTQCWEFTMYRNWDDYGQLSWKGKMHGAHRLSFIAFVGPIPDGLHCLHHCDNPPCIRPDHLYTGTDQDNMDDMVRRGRSLHRFGEACPWAKLSDDKVAAIKFLLGTNRYTHVAIAEHFNVSSRTIDGIAWGDTWSHVAPASFYDGPPIREGRRSRGERNSTAVLTELEARTVKRLLLDGYGVNYIAYRFGIGQSSISSIKKGTNWSWVEPLPEDQEIIFPSPEVVADRNRMREMRYVSSGEGTFRRRI